jgi:hypothetical protein
MSTLRQALADYLAVRRVLGYKLVRAEKLLAQFLTYSRSAFRSFMPRGYHYGPVICREPATSSSS